MIANYEKSKEEQEATVRMFCTYCWKSLLNARKDIARRQERRAKRVRLFCDMRESELNRLMPRLRALLRVAVRRRRRGRDGGRSGHGRRHPGLGRGRTGHRPAPLLRRMA